MPKQYKNIPKNIILFKVKIMPWINKTADCKILTLGKSTKYKHISEHEIFAIGTIISKCGRNDFEKSSITMLIIKPMHCTIATKKIINRSYKTFFINSHIKKINENL